MHIVHSILKVKQMNTLSYVCHSKIFSQRWENMRHISMSNKAQNIGYILFVVIYVGYWLRFMQNLFCKRHNISIVSFTKGTYQTCIVCVWLQGIWSLCMQFVCTWKSVHWLHPLRLTLLGGCAVTLSQHKSLPCCLIYMQIFISCSSYSRYFKGVNNQKSMYFLCLFNS